LNKPTVYVKQEGITNILIVELNVDGLIFIGNRSKLTKYFKIEMIEIYKMNNLGLLHLEIHQNGYRVFICKNKYALKS